jgi:hypothetical protein
MTVHSYHPDTHEHGLADGCERCAELAADPFAGLDDENLRLLAGRAVLWMRDEVYPRSQNEALALRAVERALTAARRLERAGVVIS